MTEHLREDWEEAMCIPRRKNSQRREQQGPDHAGQLLGTRGAARKPGWLGQRVARERVGPGLLGWVRQGSSQSLPSHCRSPGHAEQRSDAIRFVF